jgi:hypothetical protein
MDWMIRSAISTVTESVALDFVALLKKGPRPPNHLIPIHHFASIT